MPSCLFGCVAPKLTDEHIFGQAHMTQLTRMPEGAKVRHRRARLKGQPPFKGKEGLFEVTWEAPAANLVAPTCVCKSCNQWMDRIDHETYPLLGPMVWDSARILDVSAQLQIARWATKITMVSDTIHANPQIEPEARRWFRQSLRPPADWHVWLARLDLPSGQENFGTHPVTIYDRRFDDEAPRHVIASLCTIWLNFLLVQVLAPISSYDAMESSFELERTAALKVRRIWPPVLGEVVSWPPTRSIPWNDLDAFASPDARAAA